MHAAVRGVIEVAEDSPGHVSILDTEASTEHLLVSTAKHAHAMFTVVEPYFTSLETGRRINLLAKRWPIGTRFDAIFCRNVLIYFDRPTQQRILDRLVSFLKDGGALMLGHSEAVHGLVIGLRHVGNTIYHKEIDHAGDHPHR